MAFVPPMPPDVDVAPDAATGSIAVLVTNPAPAVPDEDAGDFQATFNELLTAAPTFDDWLTLWPTFQDSLDYVPPAPATTTLDVWRRIESEGGAGIRIAAGLAPEAGFTDWTPASAVEYQYRATAHAASNGTSTDGIWVGNLAAIYPSSLLYPSSSLFPAIA